MVNPAVRDIPLMPEYWNNAKSSAPEIASLSYYSALQLGNWGRIMAISFRSLPVKTFGMAIFRDCQRFFDVYVEIVLGGLRTRIQMVRHP